MHLADLARVLLADGAAAVDQQLQHLELGMGAPSPELPDFPLEMNWPDYDSSTVRAVTTKTVAVGEDTGLVLYVSPRGIIERFAVNVSVEDDQGRFGECPVSVREGS